MEKMNRFFNSFHFFISQITFAFLQLLNRCLETFCCFNFCIRFLLYQLNLFFGNVSFLWLQYFDLCLYYKDNWIKYVWMWSGASVAHMAPEQEDLGLILTQTQMALKDLSSPFFQTTDLKTISLICYIVMSSWNKWYYYIIIFKILIITLCLILVSKNIQIRKHYLFYLNLCLWRLKLHLP
jgi:hypothetical protein